MCPCLPDKLAVSKLRIRRAAEPERLDKLARCVSGGSVELEEVQARVRELRARVAERNTAVKVLADHLTALADDLSMWESTL